MDAVSAFTGRLKTLREAAGLSQNQLAEALGVSRGRISYYENGERTPDVEFLAMVRNYFKVDYEYLLGESEFKNAEEKADVSQKKGMLEELIENESPTVRLHLIGMFAGIHKMYNTLCGAEMKIAETFLQKVFSVLSCIDDCCEDAGTIAEGILHAAYDNITTGDFMVYSSGLLNSSLKMQIKANAIIGEILDGIRLEATEKLAEYYDMEWLGADIKPGELGKISDILKELKEQDAIDALFDKGGDV